MKVFISADIEGITGVTHWDETDLEKEASQAAVEQMTAEVVAACQGALEAGATEILIKDAHDSARNIIAARLPHEARLVRGWAPHPLMMMQGLDASFQAALLIGYHSRAGSNTSPLAHTFTGGFMRVNLNGLDASEFVFSTFSAAMLKVPLVFVTGDAGLCAEVAALNPAIGTVAVKEGMGNSTISIHPEVAIRQIREGAARAVKGDLSKCLLSLPGHFALDVQFKDHTKAYLYGFFPGASLKDPQTVHFEHAQFYEVLRFLLFAS